MAINELERFIKRIKSLLDEKPEWPRILEEGRNSLHELISSPEWFRSMMTRLVLDEQFLKLQRQTIDINSIQLYISPDKGFSIRAYIWEPGQVYPVHDHGVWDIFGPIIHQIKERKFERMDDGMNPPYAEVRQISDTILSPGETSFILPLDAGIHQIEALDEVAVTVDLYGPIIRKGFIHYFDPVKKTAQRIYSPLISKKVLAIRTLGSINESWTGRYGFQAFFLWWFTP